MFEKGSLLNTLSLFHTVSLSQVYMYWNVLSFTSYSPFLSFSQTRPLSLTNTHSHLNARLSFFYALFSITNFLIIFIYIFPSLSFSQPLCLLSIIVSLRYFTLYKKLFSVHTMVLILDGNSEQVVHTWRKIDIFEDNI